MALESSVRALIIAYLKHLKYCTFDTICGNEFQKSVPDILVCYKGRYIGLELKAPDGSLRPGQRIKLRRIQKAQGIGEGVRTLAKVKKIIACIDEGRPWENTIY